MSPHAPDLGPPPDTDLMAELLAERYPIRRDEKIAVATATDPAPGLLLTLDSAKDRFEIGVHYLRGADGRDRWVLLTDALDALFGTFIESDRAYRDLPQGTDVEYSGAFFRVDVEHKRPDLDLRADRMLEKD